MATTPLLTPRALLTSLLNTLFITPPAPTQTQSHAQINTPYPAPSHAKTTTKDSTNPLPSLPSSHRALLTTLHVLFPPPMLLQALDLLDRGLVTRFVLSPTSSTSEAEREGDVQEGLVSTVLPLRADVHLPPPNGREEAKQKGEKEAPTLYMVRSSQPQSSKGRYRDPAASSSGTIYTVHLTSWNCSCAAFAFAAFPATSTKSSAPWDLPAEEPFLENVESERERDWEFGGLSLDGKDGKGEGVPVCKHLLACLLGERWDVVGGYVKERRVGREEMAGWAAGG